MQTVLYPVIAEYDDQVDAWSILAPDFPEIVSQADNEADLAGMAQDALETIVEFRLERGDALPRPTSVVAALAGQNPAALLFYVPVPVVPRSMEPVRVNISIDKALLARIDAEATRRSMTRSGFLADAAREKLREESFG
jgi:predicted RNase H-like HicB family nuclease